MTESSTTRGSPSWKDTGAAIRELLDIPIPSTSNPQTPSFSPDQANFSGTRQQQDNLCGHNQPANPHHAARGLNVIASFTNAHNAPAQLNMCFSSGTSCCLRQSLDAPRFTVCPDLPAHVSMFGPLLARRSLLQKPYAFLCQYEDCAMGLSKCLGVSLVQFTDPHRCPVRRVI